MWFLSRIRAQDSPQFCFALEEGIKQSVQKVQECHQLVTQDLLQSKK
jgi:hypothetical protein